MSQEPPRIGLKCKSGSEDKSQLPLYTIKQCFQRDTVCAKHKAQTHKCYTYFVGTQPYTHMEKGLEEYMPGFRGNSYSRRS